MPLAYISIIADDGLVVVTVARISAVVAHVVVLFIAEMVVHGYTDGYTGEGPSIVTDTNGKVVIPHGYFDAISMDGFHEGLALATAGWNEEIRDDNLYILEIHQGTAPATPSTLADPADKPSSWAADDVSGAITAGLVPEDLQKNYTKSVFRGDVAQMFINLIEKSSGRTIDAFLTSKGVSVNSGAFTDTTDKAVLSANALGIINGVGDNKFDPSGTFTRAQISAIINRVARTLDVDTAGYTHDFADVSGHWADAELGWPVHAGIINGIGDNKFDPEGQLTAEQAIAITYRALQSLKK
jgi:hypothetical protein